MQRAPFRLILRRCVGQRYRCHRFRGAVQPYIDRGESAVAFNIPGKDDEQSLACDHSHPVERAPDPDKPGLIVFIEPNHVKAVGSDIVGSRTECHQPEECQCVSEKGRHRDGQCDATKSSPDNQLHRHNPEALGSQDVDNRTPERLNHPWKVEPARIQGNIGVGNAHPLVHNHRNKHHHHIWDTFGEIQGWDPVPRISVYGAVVFLRCTFPKSHA